MARKLYIIAGEASGDLHGANVMKELYRNEPDLEIRFWGGDKMAAVGGTLAKHIRELAYMGFVEVLKHIRTILRNIKTCKTDIENFAPDAILLIDYPGFNMRIAEWAKKKGIKVYYYISPTVWAWKEGRVEKIRRDVYKMFVILPFEKPFYAKHKLDVDYVGHPLLDAIEQYNAEPIQPLSVDANDTRPIIAVLPGSRKQELRTKLPIMLTLVDSYPNYRFIIAGAPNMDEEIYTELIAGRKNVEVIFGQTYRLLQQAEAAVVTSGTATLEAGLFQVPQVVCYIGNEISFQIAKRIVSVKYISLINLILDREVVTELIQKDCNPTRLKKEFDLIIKGGTKRESIEKAYTEIQNMLGLGGASEKVAQEVLKTI